MDDSYTIADPKSLSVSDLSPYVAPTPFLRYPSVTTCFQSYFLTDYVVPICFYSDVTEDKLLDLFGTVGAVASVGVRRNIETNESNGYASVKFYSFQDGMHTFSDRFLFPLKHDEKLI
jgi:RNA recognition motif-containing protein